MTAAVFSPFYPVSDQLDTSHRSGWARYWANELSCDLLTTSRMPELNELKRGDELYAYHGMEFRGQLNLQSGLTDEILHRVAWLCEAAKRGVKIYSLDVPMPNYGRLLSERGLDPTWAEKLSKLCGKAVKMSAPLQHPNHVVIGDSHALAMYRPDTVIVRNDSLTLWGALRRPEGLLEDIKVLDFEMDVCVDSASTLTAYYGNIDVRHHLGRQPDPKAAIKELVDEYGKQLVNFQARYDIAAVEVVMPLPIEDESRAIPKSGWYKGEPFYGQWSVRHQLRLELRDRLKKMCKKHGFTVYEHPRHFHGKDGKLTFEVMEKPRSVHIRPAEYRLVQEGQAWRG